MTLPEADWQGFCRTAAERVRTALSRYTTTAERAVQIGRGEGGDMTLAIDAAAEDVVFAELEALGVPLTAVSEERGELAIAGGGPTRVVIDPVDGSLNAKRGLPFCALSIAIASGPGMLDVEAGMISELGSPREWWAVRGEGAYLDGQRLGPLEPGSLELVGLEGATPSRVAAAAGGLRELDTHRIRVLGSVALSLCLVAAGELDAMMSLRPMRSVDAAAAQLLVREAGGYIAFPAVGPNAALDLEMRSRVVAARDENTLYRLLGVEV